MKSPVNARPSVGPRASTPAPSFVAVPAPASASGGVTVPSTPVTVADAPSASASSMQGGRVSNDFICGRSHLASR